MLRTLAVLTGLIVLVLAGAAGGAQAAASAQELGIVLHHNTAATERLPHYRASAPIAVNVAGYARRLHTLTLTAHGPHGEAIMAPMSRTGQTFSGDLQLLDAGTWTLAFSTQFGSVPAALASVALDVVPGDGAELAARCAFALGALFIIAGLTLVLRADGRPFALALAARVTKRS